MVNKNILMLDRNNSNCFKLTHSVYCNNQRHYAHIKHLKPARQPVKLASPKYVKWMTFAWKLFQKDVKCYLKHFQTKLINDNNISNPTVHVVKILITTCKKPTYPVLRSKDEDTFELSSEFKVIIVAETRPNITVAAQIKFASLKKPTNTCIIGSG